MDNQTREELLDNLLYMYGSLSAIDNLNGQIADIEDYYQTEITKEKEDNKPLTLALILGPLAGIIVFGYYEMVYLHDILGTGGIISKIAGIILSLVLSLFFAAVGALIVFVVTFLLLTLFRYGKKKQKERIARLENEWANHRRIAELQSAVTNLENEPYFLQMKAFIPQNFFNATDVAGIWELINDLRADNFKEAANLLRTQQHQMRTEQNQEQLIQNMQKIETQLEDMTEELRKSNDILLDVELNTRRTALLTAFLLMKPRK